MGGGERSAEGLGPLLVLGSVDCHWDTSLLPVSGCRGLGLYFSVFGDFPSKTVL